MLDDVEKQLQKVLFFLRNFDAAWKSPQIKQNFPPQSKNVVEDLQQSTTQLPSYSSILESYAKWDELGVWNASDLLTFALTSRLGIYLADAIEDDDQQKARDAISYTFKFINYLLLTNIHPPSEPHGDFRPYYPSPATVPRTYNDAQKQMRKDLASFLGKEIFNSQYKNEFSQFTGLTLSPTQQQFADYIESNFLPTTTPPFLVKNGGLAKELFVYYKLMREDVGYVIPTLLYQRLLRRVGTFLQSGSEKLILVRTPDFLVVRSGKVMGLELGRERGYFNTQKAALVTTFSGACGIPTTQINVAMTNPHLKEDEFYDFGFKCNLCYRAFTLPESFIQGEIGAKPSYDSLPPSDLTCNKVCGIPGGGCQDCAVRADLTNYDTGRTNSKIVHLKCVPNREKLSQDAFPLYPRIVTGDGDDGLAILREGLT